MKNGNKICTYNYNEQGKLLDKLENSKKTIYKYDKNGNRIERRRDVSPAVGEPDKSTYKYDKKGRLLEQSWHVSELYSTKALPLYRYIY